MRALNEALNLTWPAVQHSLESEHHGQIKFLMTKLLYEIPNVYSRAHRETIRDHSKTNSGTLKTHSWELSLGLGGFYVYNYLIQNS